MNRKMSIEEIKKMDSREIVAINMDKLPLDPGITKKTTIGSEEYIEVLSYLEDLRKLCDKVCYHVDKDVCDCFEKLKEEILGMLKEE